MSKAEEYLNSKDIFNHPMIHDRGNNIQYDVTELMEAYHQEQSKWISVEDVENKISEINKCNDADGLVCSYAIKQLESLLPPKETKES